MADVAPGSSGGEARAFTRLELEARNSREDALFVIDNVVYDVTTFLEDHPGGAEVLIDNAGRDASKCFHDVGHSEDARDWMRRFAVGEVVERDRWAVSRRDQGRAAGGARGALTARALLGVAGPPLALAAAAVLLYVYLFS